MADLDLNAKFTAPGIDDNDSRKYMNYVSDTGEVFAVLISENMGEVFGFDALTAGVPSLPKAFEMRKIHAVSANGKVRNSFPCGKPTTDIYAQGGTVKVARKGKAEGLVLTVTGSTGEKKRFPQTNDSGQQSGDNN